MNESLRHPLLSEAGRAQLEAWREHPRAPMWNIVCGDRLDASGLEHVRLFARSCARGPQWTSFREPPPWAREFALKYLSEVPFYRARGGDPNNWASIPPCDRLDLAREPWHFVPDALSLDEIVIYTTSGTTGSEALIPAHLRWPSTYLPLYERALELNGVPWKSERARPENQHRVPLATIAAQEHTLTFAAWSSYLDGANLKLNLHPSQWRAPEDAAAFLNEANPQVLCGDPVSLSVLAQTNFSGQPLALISSALALEPGVRATLQSRFSCPLIDIYSTNESGPIAASTSQSDALAVLPPDLWIEILRADGSSCEEDEAEEIVLSGGRNPFLPLLRYRSGDFARAQVLERAPHLLDFHGRAPIKLKAGEHEILDIDITHALRRIPLREFSLHQNLNGSLEFSYRPALGSSDTASEIEAVLRPLFEGHKLKIEELSAWSTGERKLIRYSRESGSASD